MRWALVHGVLAVILVVGCGPQPVEQASRSYKANRDYASLEAIHGQLVAGMDRAEVERLLGEPDYSPIDGQYYYTSVRRASADGRDDVPVGVVVDYRTEGGVVTGTLREFRIGPVGE